MTSFDKVFNCMKKPVVMLVFLLAVIASFFFIDKPLAIYFHQMDMRTNATFLYILTALGKWKYAVAAFFLAALFFKWVVKKPVLEKKFWYLFACVSLVNLVNLVIKISLGRARPDLLFSNNEYGFYWFKFTDLYWSCPSGHAVTITAIAAGLGVLLPRYFYIFLLCVLCVTATRVFLYYHYLSDVLMGFYLSMLVVGLLTTYCKKNNILISEAS